ncbi:hypothetical protein EEQ99_10690 [Rhizobium anhuiense]|uniref:Uncharacterized protein n=1 Tax=Rhizobium anhuiense TaxID=1184720 RepID=A0A432NS99_9HYPH|nr:hypothetical protein EEQ99_10690 [Rhizobium anhuiense]
MRCAYCCSHRSYVSGPRSFSPEDLDVLRSALDDWCAERRIDIRSVEAQFAASTALDLYQAGYDSREKLLHALRDHRIA